MGHSSGHSGNPLLHALKEIFLGACKLVLLILGWCIKGIGHLLELLGQFIIQIVGK